LFNGYDFLVKINNESIDPENNKTALIVSIFITSLIYISIVASSISVIGFKESSKFNNITKLYEFLTNKHISLFVNGIAVIVMFNATFLALLSATRFMHGLGEDNKIMFSKFWSKNSQFNSPINAIIISLLIAGLFAIINNEVVMAVISNISCILIMIILSITVLAIRYKERNDIESQKKYNYITGNINNIPIAVIINVIMLIYIFFIMIKNKFWIKKIYT
jgi:hypothetical protein